MQGWLAARQVAPDCLFAFDYAVARIALGAIKATRVSALPKTNLTIAFGDPGKKERFTNDATAERWEGGKTERSQKTCRIQCSDANPRGRMTEIV